MVEWSLQYRSVWLDGKEILEFAQRYETRNQMLDLPEKEEDIGVVVALWVPNNNNIKYAVFYICYCSFVWMLLSLFFMELTVHSSYIFYYIILVATPRPH